MHPYIPHLLEDLKNAHREDECIEEGSPLRDDLENHFEEMERWLDADEPPYTFGHYCKLQSEKSLAISKNGKLVYKKGYGKANIESNVDMTTSHRFRVASVSKTFTGVAIMRLVQAGRLILNDKVFGPGGVLGTEFGTKAYSDRVKNVTVRHLLQMTTGGWVLPNDRDAIDSNPTMKNKAFFDWMMYNALLKFEPGTRFWYVNTNYFVAARIVEKVSGKSFYH